MGFDVLPDFQDMSSRSADCAPARERRPPPRLRPTLAAPRPPGGHRRRPARACAKALARAYVACRQPFADTEVGATEAPSIVPLAWVKRAVRRGGCGCIRLISISHAQAKVHACACCGMLRRVNGLE